MADHTDTSPALGLLSLAELRASHVNRPGLIPVHFRGDSGQVEWMDLGSFHCYEGFFYESLRLYEALRGYPADRFLSSPDFLLPSFPEADFVLSDSVPPSAFIFHAGRCGSTLLVRVLARSRQNMVFSEAGPHNRLWMLPAITDRIGGFRRLVLAMARRRIPECDRHIVKFTSYNILRFHEIRSAFPGVPALFLFREPAATLESFEKGPQTWLGTDVGLPVIWHTEAETLEACFRGALEVNDRDFRILEYSSLTPDILPSILSFFRLPASSEDLARMSAAFKWYSKSPVTPKAFERPAAALRPVSPVLTSLYRELSHAAGL